MTAKPVQLPSWLNRLVHLVSLGAIFLLFYGGVNALTALRYDVGTLAFSWEHRIPLLPATLIPYCSLDVFFILSFFLCTTRTELRRLSLRLGVAIILAAICFLCWPLKLTFALADTSQMWSTTRWIVNVLAANSQFNLAPSLHVALGLLLLQHFRPRVSNGFMRFALDAWFALILVSTLTTHQHHVIDLPTGAMLWALVDWLCPREPRSDLPALGAARSKRLAISYAVGAAAFVAIAILSRGWMWTMLWPASSLAIVATGYAGLGPGIFRKRIDGTLPWSTRVLLAPVLIGTWIGRLPWRGRTPLPACIAPRVFVGEAMSLRRVRRATDATSLAILDLAAEIGGVRCDHYLSVPMLDGIVPPREQVERAIAFIHEQTAQDRTVYVHCALGYSRSVAVAAAYLASCDRETCQTEATERITRARGRTRMTRVAREACLS